MSDEEARLLHLAYNALRAIYRSGMPLDEAWPEVADEALEAIGEHLWPDTPRNPDVIDGELVPKALSS